MPIRGFPDAKRHKHCHYCRRWHEPDEGRMIVPERSGMGGWFLPLDLARGMREAVEGSDLYFACFRCLSRRRRFRIGLIVVLAALAAIVGLLRWTGVYHE
jgi:hypothetical protein